MGAAPQLRVTTPMGRVARSERWEKRSIMRGHREILSTARELNGETILGGRARVVHGGIDMTPARSS